MTLNERLDKFEKKVSNTPSNFLSKFADYKANKKWLERSSEIAVNVLEALRDKGLSQKDLAEKLQISAQQINKIVKGQQNLTIETICKIENALQISLIDMIQYKSVQKIEVASTQIKAVQQILNEELQPSSTTQNDSNNFSQKATSMKIVYKNELNYPIAV